MSVRRKTITHLQMDDEEGEEENPRDSQAESAALPRMRGKRRRETRSKEMSEEEMMDLALRLSEQEASVTELRQQEEEEAVMKAIQQSMFDQTQPPQTFSSGSSNLPSRRKLSFPNGERLPPCSPPGPENGDSPEPFSEKTEEIETKRQRRSGSRLPEMPDLSQTERTDSDASSDSLLAPPDSPQSSDSTRIDEPQMSPVFPLTGSRAVVHVDRLSQEVVENCRHSGFVSCSQDSWSWTQKSTWTRSPTFPQSNPKSPVSPSPDPEFVSSSQESPTPPLGRRSPVFPQSPSEILSTAPAHMQGKPSGREGQKRPSHCRRLPAVAEEQRDASCSSVHTPLGTNTVLVWSDEDDVTPLRSPSPVFPEERRPCGAKAPATATDTAGLDRRCTSTQLQEPATSTQKVLQPACREPPGGQTVHYFWGIPFCPRGLDPDTYTQVIEAQMEVYQQSLKQAQRRLLRKAEWGEPILPEPERASSPETAAESPRLRSSLRRGLTLRGRRTAEAAEEHPDQEEEEQDQEEEQMDADVCPETQLSADDGAEGRSLPMEPQNPRTVETSTTPEPSSLQPVPGSPELPEVQLVLQEDSRDGSAGGRTAGQGSGAAGGVGVEDGGGPSSEAAVVPSSPPTSVDCPLCQHSFPAGDIEMHAAFCNGEAAEDGRSLPGFQDSQKPRRQRARRAGAAEDSGPPSEVCRTSEKCFICQNAIPLREYSRHTELCIRRRRSKLAAKGNLLSALQDTESRSADLQPSGSKVQLDDVIDLRDDDGNAAAFRVTDSPIRTFTPISEVTDCLVDFKKQNRAKKPSQRRR